MGDEREDPGRWLVQYDTREALISTEETESILSRPERGRPATHRHSAIYLLSGLLHTPEESLGTEAETGSIGWARDGVFSGSGWRPPFWSRC